MPFTTHSMSLSMILLIYKQPLIIDSPWRTDVLSAMAWLSIVIALFLCELLHGAAMALCSVT